MHRPGTQSTPPIYIQASIAIKFHVNTCTFLPTNWHQLLTSASVSTRAPGSQFSACGHMVAVRPSLAAVQLLT